MIDFSSALYLGFRNSSQALAPWERLTLGKPAALEELPATAKASADIASLLGCERALLTPSTLHAYVDLFEIFAKSRVALFVDSGVYAITRWNVERAGAKGIPYSWFSHFDAESAKKVLRSKRLDGRIPVILTDGICTACGCAAPLNPLLQQVRRWADGWLSMTHKPSASWAISRAVGTRTVRAAVVLSVTTESTAPMSGRSVLLPKRLGRL